VGAAKPDVELSGGAYLRLVLLGAAIGIPAALVAAATTKLLFSSALFGTLLVGTANVDAVPAIVLATAAAWITVTALERRREVRPAVEPAR
jgi:hypothetical protein